MKNKRNLIQISLVIVCLVIVQIACGTSTSQQLASAVPSQSTDSNESPIATKIPPTQTQSSLPPEDLKITDYGFGQEGRTVGYGFIIENPNQDWGIESSQYQIAAYDSAGVVVTTDSGYIEFVFPGQTTGKAGELYLDEGVLVDKIEVQINSGDPTISNLSTDFIVTNEEYFPSDYYSYAIGEVANPFDKSITNLRLSAILYDDNMKIVGGGYTYLNFIPANSKTGVKLTVSGTTTTSKVKIYPAVSGLSSLLEGENYPEGSSPLNILKSGFGQDGESIGFGFIIQNDNSNYAIENSEYHITLYSGDEKVIGTAEGYIGTLLPNETLGIGGDAYLVNKQSVTKMVLQILDGDFVTSEILPTFTSKNVNFLANDYFPKVTGQIVNPYDKQITNVKVYAIAYDKDGNVIGSGFTYLDFLPANSTAAVDVTLTISGIPAAAELYATLSNLSDIE